MVAPPLRWPLALTTPRVALAELKVHLLGQIWLGQLRGTVPLTTELQLGEFLDALWRLSRLAGAAGLTLLELNPVVIDETGLPRPLDAVGRRTTPAPLRVPPPLPSVMPRLALSVKPAVVCSVLLLTMLIWSAVKAAGAVPRAASFAMLPEGSSILLKPGRHLTKYAPSGN